MPLAQMEAVADTESGIVVDAGDGTLTCRAHSHRCGSTSAFCNGGEIEADPRRSWTTSTW
jgi:hypothetical protein